MAYNLSPLGGAGWQFFDNNGNPLAGGLLYTYQAGTSTQIASYTTNSGTVANSNPIVLNSAGRPANEIWFNPIYSYKMVLEDASGNLIWTMDNLGNGLPSGSSESYQTATQGQTVFTGLSYVLSNNSLQVYVNGSKQIITLNYSETSTSSITFVSGLNLGDIVEFIVV